MKKKLLLFLWVSCALLSVDNLWGQRRFEVASPFGSESHNSSFVVNNKTMHIQSTTTTGNEFVDGGNRLVAMQNIDGGWGWPLTGASALNTVGPIAMGFAQAYQQTGDAAQLTALSNAGGYLLTKTNNFSPSDGYLAAQLDKIFGGTTYRSWVITNFYTPLASGTYNRNGSGTLYTTASYIQLIRNSRTGTSANLAAWDIGMGLVGAAMCGASTSDWIAGVEAEINELDPGTTGAENYYDVLGLAGALYGLAYVHQEFDPTAGAHAAASNLMDLANILASYQINNGGFTWNANWVIADDGDEAVQETAYAILALNQVSRSTFLSNITGAANYILSVQLPTGGFRDYNYSGSTDVENNEITGEALWGLGVSSPAPVYNLTKDVYYPTIQAAINAASPGDIINLASGTYLLTATLSINKSITLNGADAATVIIDGSGATSSNNLIDITEANVTIRNVTIDGKIPHYSVWASIAKPYYGVNISGTIPANVSFQNVTVKAFGKNGINLNGATNILFNGVASIDNGGAGFFMTDVHSISLQNITTSNNQWGGIGIATWGRYYTGGVSNVVFSGTNTFGENSGVQGGLYLEEGNYNDKANPYLITASSNPDDAANVTYLAANFGYTLNGIQDDGDPVSSDGYKRIRFYDTQDHVVTAAGTAYESSHLLSPGHLLDAGRYIIKLSDGSLYTPDGLNIQDAINAAPSGGTIDIGSGTFPHLVIDKPLTLNGNGTIITNASPAITINVSNVTVTGFTFVFNDNTLPYDDYAIDIQNDATNIIIHDCNFQNMLNGGNGNGVINRGTGTVDATLNYWNSITGPTISSNPLGTGRIATNSGGGILYYTPWYGDLAHTTTNLTEAVLLTPANLSTGVTILPIFSWQPVSAPGVTYQLEIATDISFAAPTIVYGPVAVTSPYQLPEAYALNNSTIYYWRLTSTVGLVSSSSVGHFTTIAPAMPILTYPGNLSTILGNIIYFSWYSGVPSVLYSIEFSRYSDFHAMISGFPTTASTSLNYYLAFNYSTLPSGEYYWRVKSYTSMGVLINISPAWSLLISGAPTVAPTYPVGGTTVYTSNPTLWWMPINYSYTSGIYYRVRYSTDHSYGLQTIPTTNLYATLSGLSAGQTYYYVIDASTSSTDWSAATTSIEESFTVYYATVANITVFQSYPIAGQPVYTDTPTLYWYIGMYIPGITFDLEYYDGSWHSLGSVANYYYTFTSPLPSGIYSWRVRVHGGTTWFTETFSINLFSSATFATIPIPFSPTGGMIVSSQSPSLIWLSYTISALEYQVIYSSDPTLTGGVLTYTTTPNGGSSGWLVTNSYGLTGLAPGVTYYWQVRSRLASAPATISNYSTVAQFTVSPGASPVVVIPANPIVGTNINSSAANLSWVIPAMSSSTLKYDLELSKYPDMKSSLVINDLSKPSYKIENLDLNSTYYWRVQSKTSAGLISNHSAIGSFTTGEVTSVELENIIPTQFALQQNYPNPFNPTTKITFSLPKNSFVSLKIYDLLGREIKVLANLEMNAGIHSLEWNGDNQFGQRVTSGMYLYKLTAGEFIAVKKMVLIK